MLHVLLHGAGYLVLSTWVYGMGYLVSEGLFVSPF